MKSFLVKDKVPIIRWKNIPNEIYFEGDIPEGYSLAVNPHDPYIVIDIDRHGDIDGYKNVPGKFSRELIETHSYDTKNKGSHHWFKYSGTKTLKNKASALGIDLRTNKGYVVYYPAMRGEGDIRDHIHLIKESSPKMNIWLETLFS